MVMSKRPPLDEWLSLFQAAVAAEGITTLAGAGAGNSIVDAGLAGAGPNSFISMLMVVYPGQPRLVDSMDITAFNNGTGEVTFSTAYKGVAAAIPAGVPYKIVTFRFVPAEVAALTALVNALMTDVGDASAATLGSLLNILGNPAQSFLTMTGRVVFFKDQWCNPSAVVPSLAFSNAGGDKDFPSVVLPAAGTFLPAGAVIQDVKLLIRWRKQADSSAALNAINAAGKTIRVKKTGDGWAASLVAITMANGDWSTVASATEPGDVIIGSVDIKAKVNAFGETYNVRSENTVNVGEGITVTAASLTLWGVYSGLRIFYTLA